MRVSRQSKILQITFSVPTIPHGCTFTLSQLNVSPHIVLSSVCLHIARYVLVCVFNFSLDEQKGWRKSQKYRLNGVNITKSQSSQSVLTAYDLFPFLQQSHENDNNNLCAASGQDSYNLYLYEQATRLYSGINEK